MQALSKTAAIRGSANATSISGRGTSWQVYGPYKVTNPSGPSTAINADSYTKARRIATQWRAEVALVLMGVWSEDVMIAVESHDHHYGGSTLADYITAGLKAAGRA